MQGNVLPDVLPRLDLRRLCTCMGRPFRSGTCDVGRLRLSARSPPGAFGPLRGCLPGLDPHRVCPASLPGWFGRGFQGQFGFRAVGGGNGVRLQPPAPATCFLLQQIFNDTPCPACPSPGGVLDLIAAIAVSLSPLAGVPELAPEPLGSIIQPPAQKLFGGGRRPLFQTLFAGLFLFDFIDFLSPPGREKGPRLRPFFLRNYVASICSMNLVDINLYSRVFFGKLFIKGTMVLPHLMRPRPESTFVM